MGSCAKPITVTDYDRLPLGHSGWSFFGSKAIQARSGIGKECMEAVYHIAETVHSVQLCKESCSNIKSDTN